MRDPEALLALVRAAGLPAERVTLTRNRRVMASLGDAGRTLRVHESFSSAPEPVVHALARSFVVRTPRERSAARAVVRQFLAEQPGPSNSDPPVRQPRPRPRHPLPGDEPHLLRLREEFARVNIQFFDDALPAVPLHLSGRMVRRNGHFSRAPLEIVVSRRLCVEGKAGEAEQTLRHEMIHLWQHATGRPVDHGAEFRRWARTLGVRPRATRAVRWRSG